ncbi:MAG: ribosome biosis GTPase, partial [Kosmotogales bacterium]|nr:ribosome biosis GTPase [Kosmotogales bacterium]
MIFMWYPGHIEKAKSQIRKNLKGVDAIIEILDSRIPYTSRAYEYEKIFGDKQKIIILNKIDLSDEKLTSEWVKYFKKTDKIIKANLKKSDAKSFLIKKVSPLIKSKFIEKRIMVVGMPNVGKSTFINRLKGKKSLSVGNRPGVTRGVQW